MDRPKEASKTGFSVDGKARKPSYPWLMTLDLYVARQVVGPWIGGLVLLTATLVVGRMLKLVDMVVNHGVSVAEVGTMLGFIMPAFLDLTFPMAMMLGILLGVGRMSADQELTAARASGISLYRLSAPILVLATLGCLLAFFLSLVARPWGNARLQDEIFNITRTKALAGLKERVFNSDFPGLVVYAEKIDTAHNELAGVLISDDRNRDSPYTVVARNGTLVSRPEKDVLTLRLRDGSMFGYNANKNTVHISSFDTYDLTIHPARELGVIRRDPDELSTHALLAAIKRGKGYGAATPEMLKAELARRLIVPPATLCFAIIGLVLGLKPARGGQSERFGISIAVFFGYYLLMRWGEALGEHGHVNPFLAMAVPDVLFGLVAAVLFYRAANDLTNYGRGPGDRFWELIERFERRHEGV